MNLSAKIVSCKGTRVTQKKAVWVVNWRNRKGPGKAASTMGKTIKKIS